jgi:hypothetical protein
MKRLLSIAIAVLILLSGMHFSISTHFCGGEVAAVKWSFSGKIASCGMKSLTSINHSGHKSISANCCHNKVTYFKVDNNYSPSKFQIKNVSKNILEVFNVPASYSNYPLIAANSIQINFSPPYNSLVSAVSLPDVCVFRI